MGACVVVQFIALLVYGFAVTFHIQLLQMRRHGAQVMVVGQNRVRVHAKEIDVPQPEQRHDDRHILRKRRGAKMLIHLMRAIEQITEMIRTYGQC